MATVTATRAGANYPVLGHGWNGTPKIAYGSVSLTANPAAGTLYKMVRLPKGAIIMRGSVYGHTLDTTTAPAIDIDCGVDMGGTFDTDQLGNFSTWKSAAVNGYKPEVAYNFPLGGLLLTAGPQTMTGDYNDVYLTVIASADVFDSGTITLVVEYLPPSS